MAITNVKPNLELDQEWIILMMVARELGLQKDEVKDFLRKYKTQNNHDIT
ncbi:anti-repressor SinI family protein [Pseudalkalibacillus hwajinpoensis]